jgi:DNA-binding MarR family transcriptional regulator
MGYGAMQLAGPGVFAAGALVMAVAAIAAHLGLDRSSVTGLVDRAERRGLVVRLTSERDARVTVVRITPAGRRVGRRLVASVTEGIEGLVGDVPTGDREALRRSVRSVLDGRGGFRVDRVS